MFFCRFGEEKIPRANDWAQGMRLPFPMISVFSASARGLCGRPLDSFASHVTMEKTVLGERMTDQHAGLVCSCHQLNRAKVSREGTSSRFILPCRVQGSSTLLFLKGKKEKGEAIK